MIERHTIDRIIDFCEYHNIPNMPGALQMYEGFYDDMYDKFSNKHVAEQEIWSKFKMVYQAYWDPKLKYELNKHKMRPVKPLSNYNTKNLIGLNAAFDMDTEDNNDTRT